MYKNLSWLTQICNEKLQIVVNEQKSSKRKKQLEIEDRLVIKLAEEGNLDIEYLEMLNAIENDTVTQDLPEDSKSDAGTNYQ